MERRVASDILLNAFHERYSPFEKCAVKFSTVARIVRAESVAGKYGAQNETYIED